jgi:rhomboid protease GluP
MRIRASHVLAASILMAWIASAILLKQPVTADQRSSALIALGAADSAIFKNHQWWRLLTSQWLHVKFMHMLFNVAGVLIAGAYVERRSNWAFAVATYLVGGALGQFASLYADPSDIASGASQAALALCGAAMAFSLGARGKSTLWWAALVILLVQLGLDLKVAHTVKIGHAVGLASGFAAGLAAVGRSRPKPAEAEIAPGPPS